MPIYYKKKYSKLFSNIIAPFLCIYKEKYQDKVQGLEIQIRERPVKTRVPGKLSQEATLELCFEK